MLLSEVLYIAKNINKNPLNESIKSVTLSKMLHKFDVSNITIDARRTGYGNYKKLEGRQFYEIEWEYQWKAKNNNLTQEMCDTMEGRSATIECNYAKKTTKTNYDGTKFDNGLIGKIYRVLRSNYESLGISDISDQDLISINPKDANKKAYKSSLQFWVDVYDELRAITKDNKIIMYIEKDTSWYMPDPDYHETTDFSKFATNTDVVDEYIKKAFIEIPVYKVCTTPKDIKECIGADNIKHLQLIIAMYKVYVVNNTAMQKIDISDKLNSRYEYKKFFQELLKMLENNIKRYKDTIERRKTEDQDSVIIKQINDFMNVCMDSVMELQLLELDTVNNYQDILHTYRDKGYFYDSIEIGDYWTQVLKSMLSDYTSKFINFKLKHSTYKYTYMAYYFLASSELDYFVLLNAMIKICLDYVSTIKKNYDDYILIKNNPNSKTSEVLDSLKMLKSRYNGLKGFVKNILMNSIYDSSKRGLIKINIDIDPIFIKLYKYRFISMEE